MSAVPSRRGFLGLLAGAVGALRPPAVPQGGILGGLPPRLRWPDVSYPDVLVKRFHGFAAGPVRRIGADAAGLPPASIDWIAGVGRADLGRAGVGRVGVGEPARRGTALACASTARCLKSPGGRPSAAGRSGALTVPLPSRAGRPTFAVRLADRPGTEVSNQKEDLHAGRAHSSDRMVAITFCI